LSGFAFGRRVLHRVYPNQSGGKTKTVFRVDVLISGNEFLIAPKVAVETVENLGQTVSSAKFLIRVADVRVDNLEDALQAASKIDPYSEETSRDSNGSLEEYKNPETDLYESGVYLLTSVANASPHASGTGNYMTHLFYEVVY